MALAYQLRLVQPVIALFARIFRRTLGISGAEALGGAANIFVGVEAGLTVRPFIERMTRSELHLLLTCGMATVASTTLALYVFVGAHGGARLQADASGARGARDARRCAEGRG